MNTEHDSVGDKLPAWGMYIFRLSLAFDQLINCLMLGFPDESVSGRLGRANSTPGETPKWFAKYGMIVVDYIFMIICEEKNHCMNAREPEDSFGSRPELWKWSK